MNGAVRVEVLTDQPEDRFTRGAVLYREGTDEPLTIASAEAIPDGPGWRLRFREIGDRTAAEGIRGAYLDTVVAPAGGLPRGSYYWHEVVGATVRDLADRELGRVHDVYRVGGAEVFVVRGEDFGEFDLPAVRAFIRIFAPKRGEIVVDADALGLEPVKPPRPPRPARTPKAPKATRGRSAPEGGWPGSGAPEGNAKPGRPIDAAEPSRAISAADPGAPMTEAERGRPSLRPSRAGHRGGPRPVTRSAPPPVDRQ